MCIFSSSTNFVDYLKRKLDGVDQRLCDLEYSAKNSDKESMDLKTTKNALDEHKVNLNIFFCYFICRHTSAYIYTFFMHLILPLI